MNNLKQIIEMLTKILMEGEKSLNERRKNA